MAKTKCIYCGKIGPRSKEHVVANWIHRQIQDDATEHNIVSRLRQRDLERGTLHFEQINITGNGPLGAIGLRTVCSHCNSGWMKDIVDSAQPLLQSLMAGRFHPGDDASLARWAVLTAMNVASYLPDGGAIEIDRSSFYSEGKIPSGWFVAIGLATGTPERAFTHRPAAIHINKVSQERNVIALTLCLQRAVIHILRVPEDVPIRIDIFAYANVRGLIPLYPHALPAVFWFKVSPLTCSPDCYQSEVESGSFMMVG